MMGRVRHPAATSGFALAGGQPDDVDDDSVVHFRNSHLALARVDGRSGRPIEGSLPYHQPKTCVQGDFSCPEKNVTVYWIHEGDSDPDLCEANALCVAEAPEVFDLRDDEVVDIVLPEPPPEMEAAVADAVIACPKQALRIIAD